MGRTVSRGGRWLDPATGRTYGAYFFLPFLSFFDFLLFFAISASSRYVSRFAISASARR